MLYIDCFYLCYSTALDNTDISTSNKGKTPVSTNSVKAYSKEALNNEIRKLTTINVQLMTDKMEIKKTKVNLETDKVRLFDKKNSLVVKRKKLRTEIVALNTTRLFNVPIRSHQNPFIKLIQNKLKTKRPPPFDNLKKNL